MVTIMESKKSFSATFDEGFLDSNTVRNKKINFIKAENLPYTIGFSLKCGSYWEEWMFKYIQANYIPNTNIIDLGGNIGTTTLLMSEVLSENCKIYTFEPFYSDIIFKNIIDNNLTSKVEVFQCGVGNTNETLKVKNVDLSIPNNFGAVSLVNRSETDKTSEDVDKFVEIKVFSLDSFNFENVSLIKVDVENMEIETLEGSINLIQRCKPAILIECHKINELKESNIFKTLVEMGYTIDWIPEGFNDFIMRVKNE
jgi:FkbM family methyltransferase